MFLFLIITNSDNDVVNDNDPILNQRRMFVDKDIAVI